jgi:chromate transporter
MLEKSPAAEGEAHASVTFAEALGTWAKIGVLSFGGPAGQIALMHRVIVDEKRWLSDQQFLSALNFCMLLPGPEAMQLATYVGWRLHGVAGGLVAGLLFVVPGAVVVFALSAFYAAFGNVPLVAALFVGIKAAVLAIVLQALFKVSQRALKGAGDWFIAGAAFAAIFLFKVPFPLIILTAALVGYLRGGGAGAVAVEVAGEIRLSPARTVGTIAVWLAVWIVPLMALAIVLGGDHVLAKVSFFFSKLAVVTFGGAYAVLAYMAQEAVQNYGWLKPGEMLDGLGLAETTPGPLILVTEFVGFQAGFRSVGEAGTLASWGMAFAAAMVTLWATFAPCFLWIFAGAPYVERLSRAPRLKAALAGVTAAVVGVICNLSVWFALNVVFAKVERWQFGPIDVGLPQLGSFVLVAGCLSIVAVAILFVFRRGVITTLALCGALALAWHGIGATPTG